MNAQEATETIGQWMRAFKQLRDDNGTSWRIIADKAGMDRKTPTLWAEGKSFPNLVSFLMFLDAMGLEIKIVRKGSNG